MSSGKGRCGKRDEVGRRPPRWGGRGVGGGNVLARFGAVLGGREWERKAALRRRLYVETRDLEREGEGRGGEGEGRGGAARGDGGCCWSDRIRARPWEKQQHLMAPEAEGRGWTSNLCCCLVVGGGDGGWVVMRVYMRACVRCVVWAKGAATQREGQEDERTREEGRQRASVRGGSHCTVLCCARLP